MANILCLDFDDTVIRNNLTRALFETFAEDGWQEDEARYQRGELSVEQFNMAAFDRIDADVPREALVEFARATAQPREGLIELWDWATWHGWQVAIVSNGFDVAIDPVLDELGLTRVPRHYGRTAKTYRWRVRYLSPRGIEVQSGFKVSYAQAFRSAGDFVAYVGDGASDVDAAMLARRVLARSTLLERMTGKVPAPYPFETFHDIIAVLNREAETWLKSFLSTTAGEG
ncbi:MAG: HAD-IB family phosphatase [Dehalococcoidia bacterium]